MRTAFLSLTLFCFIISAFAQNTSRNVVNKYKQANKAELLEVLHQEWENGKWQDTEKDVFTHNQQGQRILEETYQMNSGSWQLIQKTEFKFNEDGQRIEKKVNDQQEGDWQPIRKVLSSYGTGGKKYKIENFIWEEGNWTRESQILLKYNGFGQVFLRQYEVWDRITNQYQPASTVQYIFDRLTVVGTQQMTYVDGVCEKVGRSMYGNFEGYSTLRQVWQNGDWVNERRDKYATNEHDKYVLKIVQRWNGSQWVNSVMHVYEHDELQNISQEIVQHFSKEGYENENKYNWIYTRPSEAKSSTQTASKEAWHIVYPNPFTFETTIKFSNPDGKKYLLEITDQQGKLIQQVKDIITESYTIKRNTMAAGVYIYRLAGENEFKGRIVVQD